MTARERLREIAAAIDCPRDATTCDGREFAAALRTLAARLDFVCDPKRFNVLTAYGDVGPFLDAPIDPAAPCGTCKGTGIDPRGPVYDTNPPMYTPCPDCRPPLGTRE